MSNPTDALYSLDPNCGRDDWVKILMSFKSAGGDMDAAENWSAQGDTFNPQAFRATWRSIREGGYTGKTLYFLAREAGWEPTHMDTPRPAPKVQHPISKGPNPSYVKAKEFWAKAKSEGVEGHEYALKKRIGHPFGAKRASIKLGDRSGPQDCILVPNRDWQNRLIGVEAILPTGRKLTYGNKGCLVLGSPETAELIHVTEGWATAYAASQVFPRPFAAVVWFRKRIQDAVSELSERYSGRPVLHHDTDTNQDLWDLWAADNHHSYVENVLRRARV